MLDQITRLSSYMEHLLSRGRLVFSREDAQKTLGISRKAFLAAAERQQRRGRLVRPRNGFYVVVHPRYLKAGSPPIEFYIDRLMSYEECPYYVGLLKAAELHGVGDSSVPEFQVVTHKRLPRIRVGGSSISFNYKKDMDGVAGGIVEYQTDAGFIKLSSVELTTLDLLRYSRASGGLRHIATVVDALAERMDPLKLEEIASAFERSVIQRLGYLLDYMKHGKTAERLHDFLFGNFSPSWIELEKSADTGSVSEPVERNLRWKVVAREFPAPDG